MRRECAQVVVVDGLQALEFETRYFLSVMHDVAQTTERTFLQFALCCLDGTGDTEAKSAMLVDRDRHS